MEVGIISKEEIKSFESDDSHLPGHPVINLKKGIEFSKKFSRENFNCL